MKVLVCLVVAGISGLALAVPPTISNLKIASNSGSRLTVTYEVDQPCIVTARLLTNGVAVATDAYIGSLSGDAFRAVRAGVRSFRWLRLADWAASFTAQEGIDGFSVELTAWETNCPPDFLVARLDCDQAKGWVRYFPTEADLPFGGVRSDAYKQGYLLMRKIPARSVEWIMGSPVTETNRGSDEAPHKVVIDSDYYLGVYEWTQTQVAATRTNHLGWWEYGFFNNVAAVTNRAVDCSYVIARCNTSGVAAPALFWPNEPGPNSLIGYARSVTRLPLDLPSEAQWEFAARGGADTATWPDGRLYHQAYKTSGAYSFEPYTNHFTLANFGRYRYNGGFIKNANGTYTLPKNTTDTSAGPDVVGNSAPNAYGIYDLLGNMTEWCLDVYRSDNTGLGGGIAVNEPGAANITSNFVSKGGSWLTAKGEDLRPAKRMSLRYDDGRTLVVNDKDLHPTTGQAIGTSNLNGSHGFRVCLPATAFYTED